MSDRPATDAEVVAARRAAYPDWIKRMLERVEAAPVGAVSVGTMLQLVHNEMVHGLGMVHPQQVVEDLLGAGEDIALALAAVPVPVAPTGTVTSSGTVASAGTL
jgi:hypothetical protein